MQESRNHEQSAFVRERQSYNPAVAETLRRVHECNLVPEDDIPPVSPEIASMFPCTAAQPLLSIRQKPGPGTASASVSGHDLRPLHVGVVFSGGQAPGGHNVICGLWDGLQQFNPRSQLTGFIGGPSGILRNKYVQLNHDTVRTHLNTGGFDMLGTGRTKLESAEDFANCARVCKEHSLDALVIIGGDDSNTNAAFLAEYLVKIDHPTRVIGVPKTIDSDLRGPCTETSFGFDTAVRVYAELISNLAKDARSGGKYYHFVRLMGRSASHITLEAALQTQPTLALISEETARDGSTLRSIIDHIADMICRRAQNGLNHGVILIPEGLIEFVPEMKSLIEDLNDVIAGHKNYMDSLRGFTAQIEYLAGRLSKESAATLVALPADIQRQLIMDRDPHGNVALSRVETEKLLIELLAIRLGELKSEGKFSGKFAWQTHFFGYEGRCAAPTNFDANYGFNLGLVAAALCRTEARCSGYLAAVHGLAKPVTDWRGWGVPLVSMLNLERRKGQNRAVIKKTLVDLDGPAFREFCSRRGAWQESDCFLFCGPIQYFGPQSIVEQIPVSLALK